jgi:hypothetical protein
LGDVEDLIACDISDAGNVAFDDVFGHVLESFLILLVSSFPESLLSIGSFAGALGPVQIGLAAPVSSWLVVVFSLLSNVALNVLRHQRQTVIRLAPAQPRLHRRGQAIVGILERRAEGCTMIGKFDGESIRVI